MSARAQPGGALRALAIVGAALAAGPAWAQAPQVAQIAQVAQVAQVLLSAMHPELDGGTPAPDQAPGGTTSPAPAGTPGTPGAPQPLPPIAPGTSLLEPPEPFGLTPERLATIQAALIEHKLDGWLLTDFRGLDPISHRVLNLDPAGSVRTRRWYCVVPARGAPRKLLHSIEPHALDGVPGSTAWYSSWRVRDRELARLFTGLKKIALQYSPRNDIPTVGRVDAGTLELVRSMGPEVLSSADLIARIASTLSTAELKDQQRAAEIIAADLEATAREAARRISVGNPASERELQDFALSRWKEEGLGNDGERPGVAVDAHAADPHYSAPVHGSAVAGMNSVLLLDFSSRIGTGPHAIVADLTRVYFLGEKTPADVARVAAVVFRARDAAIALLQKRAAVELPVTGAEVDDEARRVITDAGFGDKFLHRTGHSIDTRGHGDGVNNDNFETHDGRRHLLNTCFSIEPGIYLPGRFGIRSEVDVCLVPGQGQKLQVDIRGLTQSEIPALLAK